MMSLAQMPHNFTKVCSEITQSTDKKPEIEKMLFCSRSTITYHIDIYNSATRVQVNTCTRYVARRQLGVHINHGDPMIETLGDLWVIRFLNPNYFSPYKTRTSVYGNSK